MAAGHSQPHIRTIPHHVTTYLLRMLAPENQNITDPPQRHSNESHSIVTTVHRPTEPPFMPWQEEALASWREEMAWLV